MNSPTASSFRPLFKLTAILVTAAVTFGSQVIGSATGMLGLSGFILLFALLDAGQALGSGAGRENSVSNTDIGEFVRRLFGPAVAPFYVLLVATSLYVSSSRASSDAKATIDPFSSSTTSMCGSRCGSSKSGGCGTGGCGASSGGSCGCGSKSPSQRSNEHPSTPSAPTAARPSVAPPRPRATVAPGMSLPGLNPPIGTVRQGSVASPNAGAESSPNAAPAPGSPSGPVRPASTITPSKPSGSTPNLPNPAPQKPADVLKSAEDRPAPPSPKPPAAASAP